MNRWLSLSLLLASSLTLFAQSNPLQPGYDLLSTSKTEEALNYFSDRLTGPQGAEATIALSFAQLQLRRGAASAATYYDYTTRDTDAARRNAYLDALWSAGRSEVSKEQYDWLEELVDNPYTRISPLAYYALGEHEHLSGNVKKARNYFAEIGTVRPWQVVGPFENISESGFDRDFGVLDQPQADAVFTNKLGVPVGWIPGVEPGRQGWLHMGNHMNTGNSISYAQTFCRSPRAQEVVFRLGASGSVKVWVNDQPVFTEWHERDTHLDAYTFAVPLQAGHNRIVVQIGASSGTGANFLLRITDTGGQLIPALEFTDQPQPYTKAVQQEQRAYPNPTEAYFRARIANEQAHYIDYLAFSQFYLMNGFHEEARSLLETARKRYPESEHVMEQLIAARRYVDDQTGASELEEYLVEYAPENAFSLMQRMQDAKDLEDWPTFESLLNTYRRLYGESEVTLGQEVVLAGGRKETERVMDLVEAGMKRYPESADVATAKAGLESGFRKRPRQAISTLEKYLKQHYRDAVVEQLIELRLQAGEASEVLELFDMLIEREPTNVNLYARLSRLYYLMGNYRGSQNALDKALALSPYTGTLYSSLAGIYAEGGEKEKAATAYEKALALNPYDFDSRDALRNLRGTSSSAFDALPKTDYYALYAGAGGQDAFPDDNSAILAYDVQQIVHPGGASETRTVVLAKALNPAGVDQWKEYSIGIYSSQQGVVETVEVLDPDGSRHEASRSGADIVFDRLQPGGAIYLVYRVKDYKYGRLAGKFWNDHPLTMALPSLQSTFSLLVPKGTEFTTKITGMQYTDLQPERSTVEGNDLYVWQIKDQPGLQVEAVTPDYSDINTTVRVSNIEDWEFIAKWYSELTYAKVRVDDNVRQATEELFADAPAGLTEREQVERIYGFVSGSIRYISVPFLQSNYVPQSAAKTLATRQGDCKDVSSLFVAMCDVRGIDANLVLINTRNRSRNDLALPGTGFNHCIARVDLDNTPYYVELTDENLPFGTGDWSVNNAFALAIPRRGESFDGTAGPVNPPSRGVNSVVRSGTVTFDNGDMIFDLKNQKINAVASGMRSSYRTDSEDNRRRSMQEAISDNYPRVELTKLSFDAGLEDVSSNTVGYDYSYRVADPSSKIGGMKIYPIVLSDQFTSPSYTTTATRKLPIDLWKTFRAEYYEQTLDVATPAGKTLVEIPESISVSNDYIDYTIEFTPTDTGFQLKRSMRLKTDIVQPDHYADFRNDILRIVEADKVNVAYQ
ncbi:hypothetical protein LEM8419_03281 [Neolewinella maritima]|uniref:DUF3857 domain-containing protein n=1 Tax=Neolewinella maritima TaxID=1383882 RepID=A0ABM9B509_9BACT|nr:DUF3857 domain-containing protein [Neolewinella maritima]CAH1002376.1 hypothetical protein LEM8419_03281 [Neolewinella maritima]